jgi:hypothetical protein
MMIFQHARHVEILNHHDGLGFRQSAGELIYCVGALLGCLAMKVAEALRRLATIATAFLLA